MEISDEAMDLWTGILVRHSDSGVKRPNNVLLGLATRHKLFHLLRGAGTAPKVMVHETGVIRRSTTDFKAYLRHSWASYIQCAYVLKKY